MPATKQPTFLGEKKTTGRIDNKNAVIANTCRALELCCAYTLRGTLSACVRTVFIYSSRAPSKRRGRDSSRSSIASFATPQKTGFRGEGAFSPPSSYTLQNGIPRLLSFIPAVSCHALPGIGESLSPVFSLSSSWGMIDGICMLRGGGGGGAQKRSPCRTGGGLSSFFPPPPIPSWLGPSRFTTVVLTYCTVVYYMPRCTIAASPARLVHRRKGQANSL